MLATTMLGFLRAQADATDARAAHLRRLAAETLSAADAADAEAVRLRAIVDELTEADPSVEREPTHWADRIWLVPPQRRLTVAEAAEAIGVSRSFLYHDSTTSTPRVPCRRTPGHIDRNGRQRDGLVYIAGELRSYIAQNEVLRQGGTVDSVALPVVRRLRQRASNG